jgi:hypothetical protein
MKLSSELRDKVACIVGNEFPILIPHCEESIFKRVIAYIGAGFNFTASASSQ